MLKCTPSHRQITLMCIIIVWSAVAIVRPVRPVLHAKSIFTTELDIVCPEHKCLIEWKKKVYVYVECTVKYLTTRVMYD